MEEEEAAVEDLELSPNNEEMAIVLFKPVNAPFIQHSPSNLSFSVDSELISGFKKGKLTPQNPFPSFTLWVLAIFLFWTLILYQNNENTKKEKVLFDCVC